MAKREVAMISESVTAAIKLAQQRDHVPEQPQEPEVMEIIGVTERAADMLVEMKGVLRVTMVGLPVGDLISGALIVEGWGHKALECPSPLNMNWGETEERALPPKPTKEPKPSKSEGGSCGESTTATTKSTVNPSKEGGITTILILSLDLLASLMRWLSW